MLTVYLCFAVVPVHFKSGMKPKQKLKVYKGKDAKLVCAVHSSPPASVSWKKGSQLITGMWMTLALSNLSCNLLLLEFFHADEKFHNVVFIDTQRYQPFQKYKN